MLCDAAVRILSRAAKLCSQQTKKLTNKEARKQSNEQTGGQVVIKREKEIRLSRSMKRDNRTHSRTDDTRG